eukprot:Selendium_serpulae@DN6109_c2_g1_i4.p1
MPLVPLTRFVVFLRGGVYIYGRHVTSSSFHTHGQEPTIDSIDNTSSFLPSDRRSVTRDNRHANASPQCRLLRRAPSNTFPIRCVSHVEGGAPTNDVRLSNVLIELRVVFLSTRLECAPPSRSTFLSVKLRTFHVATV